MYSFSFFLRCCNFLTFYLIFVVAKVTNFCCKIPNHRHICAIFYLCTGKHSSNNKQNSAYLSNGCIRAPKRGTQLDVVFHCCIHRRRPFIRPPSNRARAHRDRDRERMECLISYLADTKSCISNQLHYVPCHILE